MKLIDNLKANWKAMPKNQKAKLIVGIVCDVGTTFIASIVGNKLLSDDDGIVKRLTVQTALTGLGIGAGQYAADQFDDVIDVVFREKKGEEHA